MNHLFVIDPWVSLSFYKDSSLEFMRAALERNHHVSVVEANGLTLSEGQVVAHTHSVLLESLELKDSVQIIPLTQFDCVWMRLDPPVDGRYLSVTHLLSLAQQQGVRVINPPRALRDFNEKLSIFNFPEWISPTCVTAQFSEIRAFIREQKTVILKPLNGMGGSQIYKVEANDPNLSVILEDLTQHEQQAIMAQCYLPEIQDGDRRVLMVQGQPLPWCLARYPKNGETRGNLAAGGRGVAQKLPKTVMDIAEAVGPWLVEQGIVLAGLDIIGDYLTEINITSPTCFREIRDQVGFDGARVLIQAIEKG